MPARSGTLVLVHGFTHRYGIGWQHFLLFFLISAIIAIHVSAIALVWLVWPWGFGAALLTASLILSLVLARHAPFRYAETLPRLMLLAIALYLTNTALLHCVVRGLGYQIGIGESAYLAIALNLLAQVSITPGNLGIREIAMGAIAAQIGVPIAVGILGSSLMVALRLGLYGALWGLLEWLENTRDRGSGNPQAPP